MHLEQRQLATWLGAIVLLAALPAPAAEAPFSEVIRLVRSMRRDELMLLEVKRDFAEQASKASDASSRTACINQMKHPAITDAVALGIASQLTAPEVQQAIEFYRSATGRKLIESRYAASRGGMASNDSSLLSAAEKAQLAAFLKTSGGRKLEQQQIGYDKPSMERISMRSRLQLSDCDEDALRAKDPSVPRTLCSSLPVAGPANLCAAKYSVTERAGEKPQTDIDVDCGPGMRAGGVAASYRGAVNDIGLVWRDDTTLDVILPKDAKVLRQRPADDLKSQLQYQYRTRRDADPAGRKCWPAADVPTGARPELNEIESQPHWMTYSGEDYCVLSRRLQSGELRDAPQEATLQLRQYRKAELPFGTTELVLVESHSAHVMVRSVELVMPGGASKALTPDGGTLGFRLEGAAVEEALNLWARGTELALKYQPARGEPFTVALQRNDLEWALREFTVCRQGLSSTTSSALQ
jgi:hypothetical protein